MTCTRKYNIKAKPVRQCYKCSSDEWQHGKMVQNNSWSKTRISSSTHPFNIILERIMSDALEEHDGKVSIGENITNLHLPMTLMLVLRKSRN